MKLAYLVLALAACHKVDPKVCADTVAAITNEYDDQERHDEAQRVVYDAIANDDLARLPVAATAGIAFEPGLPLVIDPRLFGAADRQAVLRVVGAHACANKPFRVYLIATGEMPVDELGQRVELIEGTAAMVGVAIDPVLLVKLPAPVEYTPWPPHTPESVKQLAAKAFAEPDVSKRMAMISDRLKKADGSCTEIGDKTAELARDDRMAKSPAYGLPEGLAACGCKGVDLDEVHAVHHILRYSTGDLGWIRLTTKADGAPLAPGATLGDIVKGLHGDATRAFRVPGTPDKIVARECGKHELIELARTASWKRPEPKQIRDEIDQDIQMISACAEKAKVGGVVVDATATLHANGEGEFSIQVFAAGRDHKAFEVESCVRDNGRLWLDGAKTDDAGADEEWGSVRIRLYVPR
jgi:hypothetical protein